MLLGLNSLSILKLRIKKKAFRKELNLEHVACLMTRATTKELLFFEQKNC